MQRLEAARRSEAAGNLNKGEAAGSDGMEDDDESEETDEDIIEERKAAEYFEDGDADGTSPDGTSPEDGGEGDGGGVPFQQLNLSRPLLRAVEAMGFVSPTPIQKRAVPFALAGRCGSSRERNGFTLAFLLSDDCFRRPTQCMSRSDSSSLRLLQTFMRM